jgi:hypothetical protein
MPLYTFLHNLRNVLVQVENKMGLQKELLLQCLLGTFSSPANIQRIPLELCVQKRRA